jgi:hypothetical protein
MGQFADEPQGNADEFKETIQCVVNSPLAGWIRQPRLTRRDRYPTLTRATTI